MLMIAVRMILVGGAGGVPVSHQSDNIGGAVA